MNKRRNMSYFIQDYFNPKLFFLMQIFYSSIHFKINKTKTKKCSALVLDEQDEMNNSCVARNTALH